MQCLTKLVQHTRYADKMWVYNIHWQPIVNQLCAMLQVCRRDVEQSVVAQQRQEIAVLVAELRERDHELNDLVTSHQHQLAVWEQDRQLILRLQHKNHRLEGEI